MTVVGSIHVPTPKTSDLIQNQVQEKKQSSVSEKVLSGTF